MRLKLHTYLFLCFAVMALAPLLIMGAIRMQRAEAGQMDRLDREATLGAEAVAREVGQLMKAHTDAVESLSRQVEATGTLDPERLEPIVRAQHLGAETLGNMWVANAAGISLAVDPPVDDQGRPNAGTNYSDRDYYKQVSTTNVTAYSRAQLGRTTHRPNLQIVEPIRDADGAFIGLSQGAVDLAEIQALAEQVSTSSRGLRIVVLDKEGRVLAHPDAEVRATMRSVSDVGLYQPTTSGGVEVRTGNNELGVPMRAALVPISIGGLNWTVVVGRTQAELDEAVARTRNETLLVTGLSLLAGLAGAGALARLLSRPIVQLAAVAAAVGRGDFSSSLPQVHPGLPREVVQLLDAVQAMIIQLRARTDDLKYQATHDPLTTLPNRTLLRDRLEQALNAARQDAQPLALLLTDLDRFKEVNDTFGHPAGDRLLEEVSQRFSACLRAEDTIARLGGDEFAVVLPGASVDAAHTTARALLESLSTAFVVEGQEVDIGCSVGIALFPEHAADGPSLLRQADVAMYAAKRDAVGHLVYSADLDRHSADRLALMSDLRRAISGDELVLYYQPKVEFTSGEVTSVEALVRWQHPQRGLVPPDAFIPLAEQTGLIRPLTQWVLNQALRQCRAWQEIGIGVGVAVNLSMRNVHDLELPDQLAELLTRWNVPARQLRVEITESSLMADPGRALEVLTRLRTMGVSVAIDDFGTGYSSLAYLSRLPVDELKIDKSFVRDMTANPENAAIVRSTITLGHDLGLRVVAEGIEDKQTWAWLVHNKCDVAQGYYLSRPLPAEDAARWLSNWASRDDKLAA